VPAGLQARALLSLSHIAPSADLRSALMRRQAYGVFFPELCSVPLGGPPKVRLKPDTTDYTETA